MHLRRARDVMDRRYAEPLDVDDLAGIAGCSRYHFIRFSSLGSFSTRFSELVGRSPSEYRRRALASAEGKQ